MQIWSRDTMELRWDETLVLHHVIRKTSSQSISVIHSGTFKPKVRHGSIAPARLEIDVLYNFSIQVPRDLSLQEFSARCRKSGSVRLQAGTNSMISRLKYALFWLRVGQARPEGEYMDHIPESRAAGKSKIKAFTTFTEVNTGSTFAVRRSTLDFYLGGQRSKKGKPCTLKLTHLAGLQRLHTHLSTRHARPAAATDRIQHT